MMHEYTGGREEVEIIQWVSKKIGPSFTTLNSLEDIQTFNEKHDVTVIFFGKETSESF